MILEQRQHRVPDRGVVDAGVHEEHRRAVSTGVVHPEPVVADREHRVHPCTVERGSGGGDRVSRWGGGFTTVCSRTRASHDEHFVGSAGSSWEADAIVHRRGCTLLPEPRTSLILAGWIRSPSSPNGTGSS